MPRFVSNKARSSTTPQTIRIQKYLEAQDVPFRERLPNSIRRDMHSNRERVDRTNLAIGPIAIGCTLVGIGLGYCAHQINWGLVCSNLQAERSVVTATAAAPNNGSSAIAPVPQETMALGTPLPMPQPMNRSASNFSMPQGEPAVNGSAGKTPTPKEEAIDVELKSKKTFVKHPVVSADDAVVFQTR